MLGKQEAVQKLYRKLLRLYPRAFQEQLGESMQQTFDDLYRDRKRQQKGPVLSGFVLWLFLDTVLGIFQEHLLLISPGDLMQTIRKTLGPAALFSLLLLLPFMVMEVVNRRNFNEGFPIALFFFMWQLLFAVLLILLPIVRGRRAGNADLANAVTPQGNTLLSSPRPAALISVVIYLSLAILFVLDGLGWVPLDSLINGPDPEQMYLPGLFISLGLFWLAVGAGMIAGRPVAGTLRAGGSLFAHPINLTIVVIFVALLAFGLASLIIDQWPCFTGVPLCD